MSPCLSFSGTTSRGPFWALIARDEKTQTCRAPRKRPIKVGDVLSLYWRQRMPPAKKPVHLIGYAKCTAVERRKYDSFAGDDAFARRDGFDDSGELQEWFGDTELYGDEEYDVISFKLYYCALSEAELSVVSSLMKDAKTCEGLERMLDDARAKAMTLTLGARGFGMSTMLEHRAYLKLKGEVS